MSTTGSTRLAVPTHSTLPPPDVVEIAANTRPSASKSTQDTSPIGCVYVMGSLPGLHAVTRRLGVSNCTSRSVRSNGSTHVCSTSRGSVVVVVAGTGIALVLGVAGTGSCTIAASSDGSPPGRMNATPATSAIAIKTTGQGLDLLPLPGSSSRMMRGSSLTVRTRFW